MTLTTETKTIGINTFIYIEELNDFEVPVEVEFEDDGDIEVLSINATEPAHFKFFQAYIDSQYDKYSEYLIDKQVRG